jgi:hypothetical protein
VSQQKVRVARLMYAQNALKPPRGHRQFRDAAARRRRIAMVIYLDSAQNRKGAPNENFAREVMELFTLGQGRYSEQDIKEAPALLRLEPRSRYRRVPVPPAAARQRRGGVRRDGTVRQRRGARRIAGASRERPSSSSASWRIVSYADA